MAASAASIVSRLRLVLRTFTGESSLNFLEDDKTHSTSCYVLSKHCAGVFKEALRKEF